MNFARVCGSVVSNTRDESYISSRFMLIENCDSEAKGSGSYLVALDIIDSRPGDMVLVCQGSSCRWTFETENLPVDTLIVGIVDRVYSGNKTLYLG